MIQQVTDMLREFWFSMLTPQAILPHLWLYLTLVVLVMLEGPVSILVAAGAASTGFLNPLPVLIAATLGNLIADALWYSLGYFGKIDWVLSRRRWFGVDPQKLKSLKGIINRYAVRLLIFAKVTNGLIVPVLISTGVARVSWRRWFPIILVTNILTSIAMVLIGFFMASSLLHVQQGIRYVAIASTLVLLLGGYFLFRRLLSRSDLLASLEGQNQ